VDAYVDFFRGHPALAKHWTPEIEEYVRYDAVGPDGAVRSRAVEGAVLVADARVANVVVEDLERFDWHRRVAGMDRLARACPNVEHPFVEIEVGNAQSDELGAAEAATEERHDDREVPRVDVSQHVSWSDNGEAVGRLGQDGFGGTRVTFGCSWCS
jgi:hypothetical protein